MTIVDPRERYDDLIERTAEEVLPDEEFEWHADSEAAEIGWVVVAFVFDEDERVLLLDQPWADGWKPPSGVPKPGETLREAVVREVREETGVAVEPGRAHAVEEVRLYPESGDEATGFTAATFAAWAETTGLDPDPGVEDEEIADVQWFENPPANRHHPLFDRVYERCVGSSTHE